MLLIDSTYDQVMAAIKHLTLVNPLHIYYKVVLERKKVIDTIVGNTTPI
jgi:hypothetical protein